MRADAGSTSRGPRRGRRGRLPLTLLLLTAAAFLLVPAAQAFAETAHLKLNIVGDGSGEVQSVEEALSGLGRGTPPIECSYDGTSQSGECENTPELLGGEGTLYAEQLRAEPATGSELVGWTVDKGAAAECPIPGFGTICLVYAEDGEGIEWDITAEFGLSGPIPFPLNVTGSGTGSGTFKCKELPGGSEETCAAEYEEGKEVEVVDQPATGSEFVKWEGDCTGTGSCVVTMSGEKSVIAVNDLVAEPFAAAKTGEGTVECQDLTAASGLGACAPSYPYGHEVEVVATEEAGWNLESLTGTGSAAGCSASPCTFEIVESSSVQATFAAIAHPSTLTVVKGGGGQGTVLSTPAGISCGVEPCEATFEEGDTITLEATEAAGSAFAGWIGCRAVSGEVAKCQVTLTSSEVEVTAVFLTEGQQGQPGETPTLTEFDGSHEPAGEPCGGRGGLEVATATETKYVCNGTIGQDGETPTLTEFDGTHEPAGEPCGGRGGVEVATLAETKYVCNGTIGQDGERGEIGFPGPEGPQGPAGPAGSMGATGPQGVAGVQGTQGAQGPRGPQGKRGPAGKNAKVTCKVKQAKHGKKVKVTCTVKYKGGKAKGAAVSWRLTRGGHVTSHGLTTARRLNRVLAHLRPGRYLLRVDGQRATVVIPSRRVHRGHHHA